MLVFVTVNEGTRFFSFRYYQKLLNWHWSNDFEEEQVQTRQYQSLMPCVIQHCYVTYKDLTLEFRSVTHGTSILTTNTTVIYVRYKDCMLSVFAMH